MEPIHNPKSDEGKIEVQNRVYKKLMQKNDISHLFAGMGMNKADAVRFVGEFMTRGTTVKDLAAIISKMTTFDYPQAERRIVEHMHADATLDTHYYGGDLKFFKKGSRKGTVKLDGRTRNIKFTEQGMIVVVGKIFENTPAFVPFLNLLGIAIEVRGDVIDEMMETWQPIEVSQTERREELDKMNAEFAAIGGIEITEANAMLTRTYQSAYKTHYFRGDNATTAMKNCGIIKKPSHKVHQEFSAHGNKAEAYRLSVHKEAATARKHEVDVLDSPEAKRQKMKQIVKETEEGLKEDNFGRIPNVSRVAQQAAYFRRAKTPQAIQAQDQAPAPPVHTLTLTLI